MDCNEKEKKPAGGFWWDADGDGGCVNSILKFSVEARKWYLKTDVKVRLMRFILRHVEFEEIVQLWKRLQIIKKDFGEETGSLIIREAVREVKDKFNEPEWEKSILDKIAKEREGLNDSLVKMV